MAGLKVETWSIDRLIPYARNPRRNDEQVDRMASAIREFGFRIPIVARSDGSLVDGHLRLKAAQKEKKEPADCSVTMKTTSRQHPLI